MSDTLYIIVPCYNEEQALPLTVPVLRRKLGGYIASGLVSDDSRVLFVDDGSHDRTWEFISALHARDAHFSALRLSRNRGHQNALMAGLEYASSHADASISIDADLQDDVNAMDVMLGKFHSGCDIVYGVRSQRKKDSFLKRFTAEGYYRLVAALGGEIVFNHADYRLMSSRAMQALLQFPERDLFLRGMVPMLGYNTGSVEYERLERNAGESKYTLKKMLRLAVDGITSLSARPMRLVTGFGAVLFFAGLLALIICACAGVHAPSLTLISVWSAAGMVLAGVGIVGEYVGHVYDEVKARPRYFVSETLE